MSDLVRIYEASQKPRPVQAKQIPDQEVNFVDMENVYHDGWKNFQPLKETKYTPFGLAYYGQKRLNMVTPESYQPIEEGIGLHRWQPGAGYYVPGQGPE